MKTYYEILDEISNEIYGEDFITMCETITYQGEKGICCLAARQYAKQLCEDLRERCADSIERNMERGCIMATEIILP